MGISIWQIILLVFIGFYFIGYPYSYKLAIRKNRNAGTWLILYFLFGPLALIILLLLSQKGFSIKLDKKK